MNAIKLVVMAILAMAFTAFPAVAADQSKQVQKPQVSSEQRLAADQKYREEANKRLARSCVSVDCKNEPKAKQFSPGTNLFKLWTEKKL